MFNLSIGFDPPKSSTKGFGLYQKNYGKYQTIRTLFLFHFAKHGWDETPYCMIVLGNRKDCTGERKASKQYIFNLPFRRWRYQDHKLGRFIYRIQTRLYRDIDTRYKK